MMTLKGHMRLTIKRKVQLGMPENKIHIALTRLTVMGSVIRWSASGDNEVVGSEGWTAWMSGASCGAVSGDGKN